MNAEGSQLGLIKRIDLLVRNPKDAFSLFSAIERRKTAWFVFCSYFLIKFPVVVQKPYIQGRFDEKALTDTLIFLSSGLVLGLLLSLLLLLLTAWVCHWIVNFRKKPGRRFEDTFSLLLLSLAPQLLLVYELPFLFFDYDSAETYATVLAIRLIIDLLSLKTFFQGLIVLFNVNHNKAFALVLLPGTTLSLSLVKLMFG